MENETQQSVWNFDGAELYVIFEIKVKFVEALENWDLEPAYWRLRDLRRELDAKLKREKKTFEGITLKEDKEDRKKKVVTEKEDVDSRLNDLDKLRETFNKGTKNEKEKADYYLNLEEFYMHLCFLMKKHGLYFREGEGMNMIVTRR